MNDKDRSATTWYRIGGEEDGYQDFNLNLPDVPDEKGVFCGGYVRITLDNRDNSAYGTLVLNDEKGHKMVEEEFTISRADALRFVGPLLIRKPLHEALALALATLERLAPDHQHGPFNPLDGTLTTIREALKGN